MPSARLLVPALLLAFSLESSTARADEPVVTPGVRSATPPEHQLVQANRFRLQLRGAEAILAAARKKAEGMQLNVNIAVVDDGGHLIAFARMDKARPASGYTAITKATTAATFRQATGPLPLNKEPDLLLNLSLQNAAAASGGKITSLKGGLPILVAGDVIGAVGVGGGTGEQDAEIAKAGIDAFLAELAQSGIDISPKPATPK